MINGFRRLPVGFISNFGYLSLWKNKVILMENDSFFSGFPEVGDQQIGQCTFSRAAYATNSDEHVLISLKQEARSHV
jgi:hypothetical protein